jgi:transposase-like protein
MDAPKSKTPRKSKYRSLVNRKHSLIDVSQEFATEVQCIAYLEAMRWPEGVRCLRCNANRISRFVAKGRERFNRKGEVVRSPDRHLYQCLTCKHQFAVTTGTIFHDTHLPLHKWFQAVALMCDEKKGGSAMQLQRNLRIGSYRTAWYLNHRIRKAMEEEPSRLAEGRC